MGRAVQAAKDTSSLIGLYAKTYLEKGSILDSDMFYKDETLLERSRYLEITDVLLPEQLKALDLIDIRISFPNGEDYIVLQHQKVLSLLKDETDTYGLSLSFSEEDLLRLSSARVDCNLYEGAYLYTVIYQADFENAAETNYPVNPDVFSLMQWDPNIVSLFTVDKEQDKRTLLEEHLQAFTQEGISDSIQLELQEEEYNISQM